MADLIRPTATFDVPASTIDIYGAGVLCLPIPRAILPFLTGALEPLTWPDQWQGSDSEISRTTAQVMQVIAGLVTMVECALNGENGENGGQVPSDTAKAVLGALFGAQEATMGILDIEWRGCELWVRRLPCCEWENLGSGCGGTAPPADPYTPIPEPPTFSACGRANAVAEKMLAVVTSVWGARNDLPWQWISNIKKDHPDIVGGDTWFISAVLQAIEMSVLGYEFDDITLQRDIDEFKCRLELSFDASGSRLSDDEWSAINSAINGVWSPDVFVTNLWHYVKNAIGRGDLSNVAQSGATDTTANCTCPPEGDPSEGWGVYDWHHWVNLRDGVPAWLNLAGATQWASGEGLYDTPDPATSGTKPGIEFFKAAWPGDTTVKLVYVEWSAVATTTYVGNKLRIYSANPSVTFKQGNAPDTEVSGGGTWEHTILPETPWDPNANGKIQWDLEMVTGQGDNPAYQPYIRSIGIAGMGTDPVGS